jgi:hypothetical protein
MIGVRDRDYVPSSGRTFHSPWIDGALLRPRLPEVVTLHDLVPLKRRGEYLRSGLRFRMRYLAVERAARVIVPTQAVADDACEMLDLDPSRIDVVHEAADGAFHPRGNDEVARVRSEYGLPESYLLWVGGLRHPDPRKRVAALADTPRELPLVLVGEPSQWAHELPDVTLTGAVDDDDLAAIYTGAHALVFPSDDEGFGLPAVEALACGSPVAACDVPALSVAVYSACDRLIVAYLLGKDAAGIFGVAADLPRQFMVMIASSVAAATVPLVFRSLSENDAAATRERLTESLELLLVVVTPVAVWLALAADQVAGTLVGVDFRAGVSALLPTLVLARLFGIANQFYVQISFQLAERPFMLAAQSFLTLVVSVVLMVVLVAGYGIYGAALATLATEAIGLLVAIALMHRAHPVPFDFNRLAGVAISAAAMAAAILVARSQAGGTGLIALIIVSLAGGLAYALAAWLLNVANVRTLSLRFLRSFNRRALGV